jgi:hypothetical protein
VEFGLGLREYIRTDHEEGEHEHDCYELFHRTSFEIDDAELLYTLMCSRQVLCFFIENSAGTSLEALSE